MFSVELLKQKTNQQLRLLCKEQGIPQYGDKTTVVARIMEHADHHEVPSDGGGYGDGDHVEKDADEVDYMKMKRDKLVQLMKARKIGGFSGKKKEELARKLMRHDEEKARVASEKLALGEDFGQCEQCEDLPNIKHLMKAKFKCNDCNLKICGPCEIAHIKTKVTRHHTIEPLHQLHLLQHALPGFAKPSVGGISATEATSDLAASLPTWVDNLEDPDITSELLGKFQSGYSEL